MQRSLRWDDPSDIWINILISLQRFSITSERIRHNSCISYVQYFILCNLFSIIPVTVTFWCTSSLTNYTDWWKIGLKACEEHSKVGLWYHPTLPSPCLEATLRWLGAGGEWGRVGRRRWSSPGQTGGVRLALSAVNDPGITVGLDPIQTTSLV